VQLLECYLKAKYEIYRVTKESLDNAVLILNNGIEIFGENALLYATLGEAKYFYYDVGLDISEKNLQEVEDCAKKALLLEPGIAEGYKLYGFLERGSGSLLEAFKYMSDAYNIDPDDPSILMYKAAFTGIYIGKPLLAEPLYKKLLEIDPLSAINYLFSAFNQYIKGDFRKAIELLGRSSQVDPDLFHNEFWLPTFLTANNQLDEAFKILEKIINDKRTPPTFKELAIFIKYAFLGDKAQAMKVLSEETKMYTWCDPDFSGLMPGYYSLIHEKEEALKYLNHAVNRGFINYPFFSKIDPFLENIRGDERFTKLMERVKHVWENFEV
jgi:tetratricopeptide (TPR) repeat protein